MAKDNVIVDIDYNGNALLNKGEENIAASAIIAPASIAANTNDYNPSNLQSASILKISSTAAFSITGITAPDTARNKMLLLFNTGAFNITLPNQNAGSAAANRFNFAADVIIVPNSGVILIYDQTLSRWIFFAKSTNNETNFLISGFFRRNGNIIDTLNATTNNYNPAGLATANRLILNVTGAFQLTGIQAQPDGTELIIINTSNVNTLTVANNSASSVGANRFLMNANITLAPNQSCTVQYDGTQSRWRVISHL